MYYYEVHCGLGKCSFLCHFKDERKLYGEEAIVTALVQLDQRSENIDDPFDEDDVREVNYAKEISKEDFDKQKITY
jgi:hypothetical protein